MILFNKLNEVRLGIIEVCPPGAGGAPFRGSLRKEWRPKADAERRSGGQYYPPLLCHHFCATVNPCAPYTLCKGLFQKTLDAQLSVVRPRLDFKSARP